MNELPAQKNTKKPYIKPSITLREGLIDCVIRLVAILERVEVDQIDQEYIRNLNEMDLITQIRYFVEVLVAQQLKSQLLSLSQE